MIKQFAEINGKLWESSLTFCGGCPEYIVFNGCGYEGNGCRYPESRINRPVSFSAAYFEITKRLGKDPELYATELGSCVKEN